MKHVCLALLIAYWGFSSCQTQPNTSQIEQKNSIRLSLQVLDKSDKSLIIRDGAKLKLYKDQNLLQEVTVQDNEALVDKVQLPPPYRYSLTQVFVDGYELDKGVPIDTQGGLITPKTPAALPLPPELILPSGSPGANLEGQIEQDLRTEVFLNIQLKWIQ